MAGRCVPPAAAVAELLTSLFGKPTKAVKGSAAGRTMKAGVSYADGDGQTMAVALCDLEFAAAVAAALSMLPPAIAAEAAKKGVLAESLLENVREVFNVLSSLLNVGCDNHVRAASFYLPPKTVPADVTAFSTKAKLRAEYDVTVQGYAPSKLLFFVNNS